MEQASENITQQTVSEQPVSEEVIAAEQDIPAADDEAPSVEAEKRLQPRRKFSPPRFLRFRQA